MPGNDSKLLTITQSFALLTGLAFVYKTAEFNHAVTEFLSNILHLIINVILLIAIIVFILFLIVQFYAQVGEILNSIGKITIPIATSGVPLLIPIICSYFVNNIVIIALTTLGVSNAYEIVNTVTFSSMYWISSYGIIIGLYVTTYKNKLEAEINYWMFINLKAFFIIVW